MEVGVVGGGASGMFAALILARGGVKVELFEGNEKLGKKLYITGKGRCNLMNDCDVATFFDNVVNGAKFLRSAIYTLPPSQTMEFFEELGLPLTVERGNRVFPTSGKSSDVIRALSDELSRLKVTIRLGARVSDVAKRGDKFEITANGEKHMFDAVVIATGGKSYPSTGSTGDGYKFAKAFGHNVIEPRPALVALETVDDVSFLEGLSLKNVRLSAFCSAKELASEFGEMLFTSKGISGPIALSVSSYIARSDSIRLSLDLKPALDRATLDARLLREFSAAQNQDVKNVMRALLPERLIGFVLDRAGVRGNTKVNALLKEERASIIDALKGLELKVKRAAPFSEAVITSGGVDVSELFPSGESRLASGLFFVGETTDVDALTGGFNLQIAWSTAYLAATTLLKRS